MYLPEKKRIVSQRYLNGIGNPNLSQGLNVADGQIEISDTDVETEIIAATFNNKYLALGSTFRFGFQGMHQNQNATGTLTFRIYIGENSGQTIQASYSSNQSSTFMEFRGLASIRGTGIDGSFIATGIYSIYPSESTVLNFTQGGNTNTSLNTQIKDPIVKLTAEWSSAHNNNELLIENAYLEYNTVASLSISDGKFKVKDKKDKKLKMANFSNIKIKKK
jgi:hypothetical protein